MIFSPGDLLLFALSDHDAMPWIHFSSAVAELNTDKDEGGLALKRFQTAELLSGLGHCDRVVRDGKQVVAAAPAALARLPVTGLPIAVLVGRRQSRTVEELTAVCRSVAGSQLDVEPSEIRSALVPSRISVVGEAESHVAEVAMRVGIPYISVPAAWTLAVVSGDLDTVHDALLWEERSQLNWVKRRFDPVKLRMALPDQVLESPSEFWAYEDPYSRRAKFFLRRNGAEAEIGREWGRWSILSSLGTSVLCFDSRRNLLASPRSVPLPALLARSLTLCSGRVPDAAEFSGRVHHVYGSVPLAIASAIAKRLGQQLLNRDINLPRRTPL